ncbi:hypothetical protein [Actinokineospora sp. NBRC 105648]|uniref:hypothetical protein n=1 Tax=Actinokineospora sp. NBRC 105648 TaxID=3032206 RepID=UPI002554437B|nr:hypothetical protein [Actinokineospora sp. NBRC 105648]
MRAAGPATAGNRISLTELARIASNLQATLERIAMSITGARPRSGRRPVEIAESVRMDFVGFSHGSAVLALRPAEKASLDGLLDASFTTLVEGIRQIRASGERPSGEVESHFSTSVLNGLVTLCGGIGESNLTAIEFKTGADVHFTLDGEIQRHLRRIQRSNLEAETTIVGRLHMGDFEPLSLRCRVDTNLGSIWCDFDIDLRDDVLNSLDHLVMATGSAELHSDGSVRLLHLTGLSVIESSRSASLRELAAEQGVTPLRWIGELRGVETDDVDVFLEGIRIARGSDE